MSLFPIRAPAISSLHLPVTHKVNMLANSWQMPIFTHPTNTDNITMDLELCVWSLDEFKFNIYSPLSSAGSAQGAVRAFSLNTAACCWTIIRECWDWTRTVTLQARKPKMLYNSVELTGNEELGDNYEFITMSIPLVMWSIVNVKYWLYNWL